MQRPEDLIAYVQRVEQRIEGVAARHAQRSRTLELELSDELAAIRQSLQELVTVLDH
jgi:hypothetical protein